MDSGATLQCYCTGTFANEDGNSTLNLGTISVLIISPGRFLHYITQIRLLTLIYVEEYIANYNGHLLSSLEGTPTVPSDASIAVPANVVLTLGGYTDTATCPSTFGATLNFAGPEACWDINLAVDPIVWTGFMVTSNEGWSVSVYNVSTCTGTPLVTFDQGSVNQCIAVGQNGGAYLSVTPLWNYD